jgi:hypothetical protein
MNTLTWWILGFDVCATIIAILLVFIYRRKFKGVVHYERIRDKLLFRKPKPQVESEPLDDGNILGRLVGGFVVILVGLNLLPAIGNQVKTAQSSLSPVGNQLLDMVTIFYTLGICAAGLILVRAAFRKGGIL